MLNTIKVGTRAWGIASSPDEKLLYVANGPSNDVSVVDVGAELFAMSACVVRAQMLGTDEAIELADLFCRSARLRVEVLLRGLWHNQDDLNQLNRKTLPDIVSAVLRGTTQAYFDVARPTDQIDRTVNPTLVPANLSFGSTMGPARPAVNFQKTDFWAQGVSFGFEIRY